MQTAIARYSFVMAAFMVTGAKLADRWGRGRVFLLGALTYGTGASITALTRSSAVALGLVLVVFAIPVLALIGLYAAVLQRASEVLGSLRTWTEKNTHAITVVLCFTFGAFFLKGGLWGPCDHE